MEILFVIIFIIVVIVKNMRKAEKNGSGSSSAANRAPQASSQAYRYAQAQSRQQPAYRTAGTNPQRYATSSNTGTFARSPFVKQGSANIGQRDGRVYASIDFDNTHYHAEGFDFDCCISFKGLPPGTDELAVLIASNNRHERELAKLMKERQA